MIIASQLRMVLPRKKVITRTMFILNIRDAYVNLELIIHELIATKVGEFPRTALCHRKIIFQFPIFHLLRAMLLEEEETVIYYSLPSDC